MTTNIKLRKVRKKDFSYFLKWWKDKELIELTSGIYEKSDDILYDYFLDILRSKKDHHYIILLGNKVIGHVALTHKNLSSFEIHIIIGEKKYRGKGYGSEAIRRAVKIAFTRFHYSRAYLEVRPENIRAIKAYEACNFIKQGFKKYPKNNHQPVVLKMMLNKNSPK